MTTDLSARLDAIESVCRETIADGTATEKEQALAQVTLTAIAALRAQYERHRGRNSFSERAMYDALHSIADNFPTDLTVTGGSR